MLLNWRHSILPTFLRDLCDSIRKLIFKHSYRGSTLDLQNQVWTVSNGKQQILAKIKKRLGIGILSADIRRSL